MRERPILMSGPMVRAVLEGRKTQTRRVAKVPQWIIDNDDDASPELVQSRASIHCPYGQPGDRLWVRETFTVSSNYHADCRDQQPPFNDGRPTRKHDDPDYPYWEQCYYAATDPCPELLSVDTDSIEQRWKPSIHMPRWASRLSLEITEVRVERVQEITPADCEAEGLTKRGHWWDVGANWEGDGIADDPVEAYRALWDSLNAKRGDSCPCKGANDCCDARWTPSPFSWDANPWVWCISFRPVEAASLSRASRRKQVKHG